MNLEQIPQNEYCLFQLPLFLKSDKKLDSVVGERKSFISSVKQGSQVSISLFPDNPLMGRCDVHAKPSNKLIMKIEKKDGKTSGFIVGRGILNL